MKLPFLRPIDYPEVLQSIGPSSDIFPLVGRSFLPPSRSHILGMKLSGLESGKTCSCWSANLKSGEHPELVSGLWPVADRIWLSRADRPIKEWSWSLSTVTGPIPPARTFVRILGAEDSLNRRAQHWKWSISEPILTANLGYFWKAGWMGIWRKTWSPTKAQFRCGVPCPCFQLKGSPYSVHQGRKIWLLIWPILPRHQPSNLQL